ncbi:hypothetical protein [Algoriphagus confluentis]|uniref:Glycosyltransferase RgtA/B/C/D-like domain-containing protein n=1 Tax=Algoriphagus confluentis TaxID=1697556 RepID=A0ABQ6PNI5_9BACT|nr:hypothetical protein Aconfl_21920 [Algoriphagus confluentis]
MPKPLLGASILVVAIVLAGVNRGFDVSDEGLYVLLAHPLQENQGGIFNYDLFFKLIHQVTGFHFGMVGLRVLRLLIYGLGAFALAVCYKNVKSETQLSPTIFLISLLGLFAGYGFLPASLSYNHLSVVIAACWLALISFQEDRWMVRLGIGLMIAFLVYVKVTVAILVAGMTLLFLFLEKKLNWFFLLGLLLPFIFLEWVFYWDLGENALLRLRDGLSVQTARTDYQGWTLIKHTGVGVFWCLLVFGGSFIVFRWIKKPIIQALLILPSFLLVFSITRITEEWNHIFLLLGAGVWAWFFHKYHFFQLSGRDQIWIFFLLLLPFVLHFGSNVYWMRIGIHYLVFWILAWWIWLGKNNLRLEKALSLSLAGVTGILVLNGLWWQPFEQGQLEQQTEKWEYLPGKVILLSPDQVRGLEQLSARFEGEEKLLAAYRISGLAYLLGKTLPKSPGFWDREQLEGFFPQGYAEDVLFYPIDSLPQNFIQEPILISNFQ